MRGAHDPARLGGGGLRCRAKPQHQRGDAAFACGQRQLAAGDEIKRTRLAPDLGDHSAERVAGKTVGGGTQYDVRRRRTHDNKVTRIEPQLGKACHRQLAGLDRGKILPDPENEALALREAPRQPERKTRGGRGLRACASKHLMHCAQRKPALQRGIGAGMAQRSALQQTFAAAALQPLHFTAQGCNAWRCNA